MDLDPFLQDWTSSSSPAARDSGEASSRSKAGARRIKANTDILSQDDLPPQTPLLSSTASWSARGLVGLRFAEYTSGADGGSNDRTRLQARNTQHSSTGNLNPYSRPHERSSLVKPHERSSLVKPHERSGLVKPHERSSLVRGVSTESPLPASSSERRRGRRPAAFKHDDEGAGERRKNGPKEIRNAPQQCKENADVAAPILLSRRKAPIAPAVQYIMEVMCTDLVACGECFVPDTGTGQTLVRLGGFVPTAAHDALDGETSRFMEGPDDEAYGRGVGLPGMAWATSKTKVVEISTLTTDSSFDSGGDR